MSSSPPPETGSVGQRLAARLAPRSLTARLIITTLALVALVSIIVVSVTALALHRFLLNRLDDQLTAASQRHDDKDGLGRPGGLGLPPLPCGVADAGFGFGQAPGTLIGHFDPGCRQAVIISTSGSPTYTKLDDHDTGVLSHLTAASHPVTVSLSVGDYRVLVEGDGVTGLPTADVTDTVRNLVLSEAGVALGGVLLAALVGQALVRRQLSPLRRVAATATAVTRMPLDSGEVGVIDRVPAELTDPGTEVGQVGAAINAMLGHVERALDTRHESEQRVRQFLADASHELRTPLSTIRGYAELTRRTAADPAAMTHAMSRIDAESLRMAELVDDLLLLARLDSGRPLVSDEVDVSRLLAEAVNDARVLSPDHVWQLTLPPDPLVVDGDRDRLHQVVANLLTNAIRHTPEGTTVSVSAAPAGSPAVGGQSGGVVLSVHDDGPGLPAELVAKAFERFSRGDSSRTRGSGGAGLGLSIVHAIVSAHRGTVAISSVPGDTTIDVTFP